MLVGPPKIERAARDDHQHRGLAERDDTFEQARLQPGKLKIHFVPCPIRVALVPLLALDFGGQTQAEHDCVGALSDTHRFGQVSGAVQAIEPGPLSLATWGVPHLGLRANRSTDSLERGHRTRRGSAVVGAKDLMVVGIGTDDCDAAQILAQRQKPAVILEQNHRRRGRGAGEGSVLIAVVGLIGNGRVGHTLGRIEHAQTHARTEKPAQAGVEIFFAHKPSGHRGGNVTVGTAAV